MSGVTVQRCETPSLEWGRLIDLKGFQIPEPAQFHGNSTLGGAWLRANTRAQPGGFMTTGRTDTKLSERLREATKHAHAGAQGSAFVRELFAGKLNRGLYSRMVAQHYFIYAALEDTAATMSSDPTARAFLAPELARVPSLERDLEFLLGDAWRDQVAPTAATVAYVERISETAGDSAGFVAHHYVRYLGDLSG